MTHRQNPAERLVEWCKRTVLHTRVSPEFGADNRGVSFTIGYVITTGIAAVLVISLIAGTGSVLEAETSVAATSEVESVTSTASGVIEKTDRVGRIGDSSNVTLVQPLQRPDFASMHRITLHNDSGSPQLTVTTVGATQAETSVTVTVALRVTADIEPTVVNGAEKLQVVHKTAPNGSRTLFIESKDGSKVPAGGNP